MGQVEEIKRIVDTVNIELKLYRLPGNKHGEFCVRVRDIDAEENYAIVQFKTLPLAEAYFMNLLKSHDLPGDYEERHAPPSDAVTRG